MFPICTYLLMLLGEDLPCVKMTCGRSTTCVPMCRRVLSASAIRPVARTLHFATENTSSVGLKHGAYGGMRTSSTPDRIGKSLNAWGMVKCYIVQFKDVAIPQGKVFSDSTMKMLLREPSLRAKIEAAEYMHCIWNT
jgi:hypothetical protein